MILYIICIICIYVCVCVCIYMYIYIYIYSEHFLGVVAGADRITGESDTSYIIYILYILYTSYVYIQKIFLALWLVLIEMLESLADGIGPAMEHMLKYYLKHREVCVYTVHIIHTCVHKYHWACDGESTTSSDIYAQVVPLRSCVDMR